LESFVHPHDKSSEPAGTEDVITQRELASQLIFQRAEFPHRQSLWERYKKGAQIEPGPLTIVHPYVDLGPFIIPTSEGTRRAEEVRHSIRQANLALEEIERGGSINQFSKASQQITARTWEALQERRTASLQARNWSGFRALVRDHLYACELTWMLWATNKCIAYRLAWLGSKAFGAACARAVSLAPV
jgi:hypothetical protein